MGLVETFIREGKEGLTDFKDPFDKECVIRISTWCHKNFHGSWDYSGTVEFKNGNTKGEQDFDGISLADVLNKMEVFVKKL